MPVAHLEVFQEGIAQGLGQAAFDLSLDLLPIDGFANIMDADDAQTLHLAGERVDFDLDGLGGVAIAVVGPAGAGVRHRAAVVAGGRY